MKHIVIIGGGAAGFFAAITCAEKNPSYRITILERSSQLLQKVKISGGGRCNVTHACFDPKALVKYYPRGEKQLLGPFNKFNPSNTIEWFLSRGVELKTEEDGRMFPVTDSSQTIINCFLDEARKLGIEILMQTSADEFKYDSANHKWLIQTNQKESIAADAIIICSGSSLRVWQMLEKLGHRMVPPVPSLFTFNIRDERIKGLEGLCVKHSTVTIQNHKDSAQGALLITHWGMSGPAVLRLSAWAALELAAINHQFKIEVNCTGDLSFEKVKNEILRFKEKHPKQNVLSNPLFGIPKRLWERLLAHSFKKDLSKTNYADLSNKQISELAMANRCGPCSSFSPPSSAEKSIRLPISQHH